MVGVVALAFQSAGTVLALGGRDGQIRLADLGRQEAAPRDIAAHRGAVNALAFDSAGALLASGGADAIVRLWDVASGDERAALRGHTRAVTALAVAGDPAVLAAAGDDGTIRLWRTGRPEADPVVIRASTDRLFAVALHPFGRTVATGGADGRVMVWPLAEVLAEQACAVAWRQIPDLEWRQLAGPDVPQERPCGAVTPSAAVRR
jgi:WD40 repeat protein